MVSMHYAFQTESKLYLVLGKLKLEHIFMLMNDWMDEDCGMVIVTVLHLQIM